MTHAGVSLVGLAFFKPILAFLILFVVMFALLKKTKILGEETFIQLLSSFIVATIFVTAGGVRELVLVSTQGFGVLLMAMFFILIFVGFLGGKSEEIIGKGIGWFFVVVMLLIFLIAGAKIFGGNLGAYIPGPHYGNGNPNVIYLLDVLYSPSVMGTILFVIITGIVMFVLVKSGK